MASQDPGLQPLDTNLFRDNDDEEDLFWKRKLEALINNDVTPSQAATDFDLCIVEEANTRHAELLKRPDPRNLTDEEEANGLVSMRAIAPNPSGNIELVFPWIATLCSAFPPHHEKQDKIIQFLEALRDMPKHEVYEGVPPEDPDEPYGTTTLWPFGGSWIALPELFRVESYGTSAPSPHARNHVTDIDRILLYILRYRNTRQRNSTQLAKLPICHRTTHFIRAD